MLVLAGGDVRFCQVLRLILMSTFVHARAANVLICSKRSMSSFVIILDALLMLSFAFIRQRLPR
ncbi:hypothetical protein ABIA23_001750 [Sinorhizobium fredii]